MRKIYLFNPDSDMALANGSPYYMTPVRVKKMAVDMAVLPVWYADAGSEIWLTDLRQQSWLEECPLSLPVTGTFHPEDLSDYHNVSPWGWNPALIRRLREMGIELEALPSDERMKSLRNLSSRQRAVELLPKLQGIGRIGESCWLTSVDAVKSYATRFQKVLLKAPWSSSGKGLQPIEGQPDVNLCGWIRRIIASQGGIVGEPFYEKVLDFAMEFQATDTEMRFVGYSWFEADSRGIYKENKLVSDLAVEKRLASYVSMDDVYRLREQLVHELSLLAKGLYQGYLGVDMMIVRTEKGYALHPCVEVNWRMNMGVLARLFFNRYVDAESEGRYVMEYYQQDGDALTFHEQMLQQYPLQIEDGRIKEGYLSLTPVFKDTSYQAYVVIEKRVC